MQVQKFADNERDEWLAARRGKITGSKLKDVYSKRDPDKKKIGFYELIAERLGLPPETDENAMERGTRLEGDALARFADETGKELDTTKQIWSRDDDESIAISPDGVVVQNRNMNQVYEEAIETKCLSSARHIEAYLTKKVPDDYEMQVIQYFIVNDDLQRLYFAFYDPRFALFNAEGKVSTEENPNAKLDFFYITIERADVQAKVEEYLIFERKTLKEISDIVNQLTF